jgi:hypothetical protein
MSFGDILVMPFWLLGLGAGVFWFVKGFLRYRAYRFLADTPEVSIRSMPMGLVHFHGKAWGENTLQSPVTHTPCFFYKVVIDRLDDENGRWRPCMTDTNGVEFFLQDQTGRVRIDAHGAVLDLPRAIRCRTGNVFWLGAFVDLIRNWKSLTASHTLPALDEDLRAYVGSLGPEVGGQFRLTEYCLLPNYWYDVIGTCAENPNARDERERNMIVKGDNEPTFLISFRSGPRLETNLRARALRFIFAGGAIAIFSLAVILSKFGLL